MSTKKSEDFFIDTKEFNPTNFLKENSFYILITKFKEFLKNISPKKDLIDNNNLAKLIERKIIILNNMIEGNEKSNNINITNEFYKKFTSLIIIDRDDSEYAKQIRRIIEEKKVID